ncbi:hypothetical protein RM578_08400 [Staphylococcus haemolyticus]|uniref:hypothetical protein n=1 Tax=Staphylococcus TaxID=1279 RepID=UPI00187DEA4C|nr:MULTISPECIES: hypothetical protein [Staphylococcus]MBF2756370.1 hypothetical protein [Staphylococcus haemolyticus]MBF2773617.1 hypothetical protein [Staphylococcus haemolyticus]MBF2775734.1 hypothetical protein [Staphylococcus haemolyticus]MBF2816661.1 hypothetical protein [Staphylococcus haemolyticus]MBF9719924.1 hypothetical protein [Staphylococcus haemolyticus]
MKSIKLVKYKGILHTSKRIKDTNHLKKSLPYLDKSIKRLDNNYSPAIIKLKLPNFDIVRIKPHLTNIENIVRKAQKHAPTINNLMAGNIIKVNRALNDSFKVHKNLINNITTNIDISKLQKTFNLLKESLIEFIKYSEKYRLSMKLEYFSDYYDIYLEKHKITDEDIYVTFKSHYVTIKNNLIENDFYYPKRSYIQRVIDNFENKRYTETSMLALASIDYLTIYNTFQEEREANYKSINMILNKDLLDNEEEIEQVITQYTVKLIKEYYGINNDIDDPDYINRNRLMHGIMDIESIKKIDCIKLLYLIDVLSTIKVELVKD